MILKYLERSERIGNHQQSTVSCYSPTDTRLTNVRSNDLFVKLLDITMQVYHFCNRKPLLYLKVYSKYLRYDVLIYEY